MDYVEKTPGRIEVATILREAILSGEFKAGHELSLTGTAVMPRVSSTPVREAFQPLEAEGLLELRMNRGAIVTPINTKFVTDHFDMRRMLEGEAVFRAVNNNMPAESLRAPQNSIQAMASIPNDVYDEYDFRFHQTFRSGSQNNKLCFFLDTLWNGPSYSHTRGKQVDHSSSVIEHGLILDYAESHGAERARDIMHVHIDRSRQIILDARIS
ncbi:MAG: GntR family transcriptional regulator [Planctomycetota bacterium]|nr:GntR family transcriptional regulator [Planctomycetota bacterium]